VGLSPRLELHQAPTPDPTWSEHWHFDFWDADAEVGGFVRIGRDPGLDRVWYWACLVRAAIPPELALVIDPSVSFAPRNRLELRSEGVWADHICETPFEHWTIGLEAYAVALDDPTEAYGRMYGDRVPVGYDLEWEALPDHQPDRGVVPATDGYEQACVVHGEILVGNEAIDLSGFGHRHHRWGPADWLQGSHFSVSARLDDTSTLAMSGHRGVVSGRFRSPEGTVEIESGGLTPHDRSNDPSTSRVGAAPAFPSRLRLDATHSGGGGSGHLGAEVEVVRWAPIRIETPGHPDVLMPRALCWFRFEDGRTGTGWIEGIRPSAQGSDPEHSLGGSRPELG